MALLLLCTSWMDGWSSNFAVWKCLVFPPNYDIWPDCLSISLHQGESSSVATVLIHVSSSDCMGWLSALRAALSFVATCQTVCSTQCLFVRQPDTIIFFTIRPYSISWLSRELLLLEVCRPILFCLLMLMMKNKDTKGLMVTRTISLTKYKIIDTIITTSTD